MSGSDDDQLRGPHNWHPWISDIRLRTDSKTWALVDPDKIDKPAPVSRPVTPTCKDVNPTATNFSELTNGDITHLEILYMMHKMRFDDYDCQQRELARLRSRIADTVGKFQYLIQDEDNVAKQLSILSTHVKPTDEEYRRIARDQYRSALQRSPASDIRDWIFTWQVKYLQAKRLDLPMTKGLCPIFHFLRAVAPIEPFFCDLWEMKIEYLAQCGGAGWQNEVPDAMDISTRFHNELCSTLSEHGPVTAYDGVCYESQRSSARPPRKNLFLKGRGNPNAQTESSEEAYWSRVRNLLWELRNGLNGHRLDDYIKCWRKVILECQRFDIYPIGSHTTDDFLTAVRDIYPMFARYWQMKLEYGPNKVIDKTRIPDAVRITQIFERCYKRKVLVPIDAAFGFESKSYDLEPPRRIRAKPPKRTGTPMSRCLCGMQHHYAACFYLVDEIRPAHWLPYTDVASKVFKQLQNPSVKARVLRAMNQAKE